MIPMVRHWVRLNSKEDKLFLNEFSYTGCINFEGYFRLLLIILQLN